MPQRWLEWFLSFNKDSPALDTKSRLGPTAMWKQTWAGSSCLTWAEADTSGLLAQQNGTWAVQLGLALMPAQDMFK